MWEVIKLEDIMTREMNDDIERILLTIAIKRREDEQFLRKCTFLGLLLQERMLNHYSRFTDVPSWSLNVDPMLIAQLSILIIHQRCSSSTS